MEVKVTVNDIDGMEGVFSLYNWNKSEFILRLMLSHPHCVCAREIRMTRHSNANYIKDMRKL